MRDTSIARDWIADHLRKRAARNLGVTRREPRGPKGHGAALQNDLGIIVGRPAEFERPDDSGFFTDDARLRFLWWVSVLEPEVLRELQGQVATLPPEGRSTGVKRWCARHNLAAEWIGLAGARTANVMADPEAYEEHRALQRTIRGIRRSYGCQIDEPQLEWTDVRFTVPPERWDAPHAAALIESLGLPGWWADMPAFPFEHRAWDPLNEPESTFRDSARRAFESALEEYMAGMASEARERGAEPGTRRRGRGKDVHFQWFVRFQVGNETHMAIARNWSRDASVSRELSAKAVAKACRDISELIGLARRSKVQAGQDPPHESVLDPIRTSWEAES